MLLFFLASLLTLNLSTQLPQPTLVNQVISFDKIEDKPVSLGIDLTAKSALVIDLSSNKVLFAKNIEQPLPIASLTKLMTADIFLGTNPDWSLQIEYKKEDNTDSEQKGKSLEPSQIAFSDGEKINLKDLFTAALVKSANNVIKTIVRQTPFCCGNNFVGQMNQKAGGLGMKQTIFIEPTGLNSGNLSSAQDLAKLIMEVKDKKEITEALANKIYSFKTTLSGGTKSYQVKNTNKLLNSFLTVNLGKTGYLEEAGYCFAGITEYQKNDFIVILLGANSEQDRAQEVKGLTVWAAENK
ncbi:MAG: serine hydrolase [Patescibacteria group bacterium]|nr:serine hydrolase [Patescibacteria group bacterium]MDD5121398.1 serine hydrolase [Patescibacteria group bacterium]MDD5221876.1 serine hydrolase [Patescibacteria group bacterium]MDD5395683.1 serine hydrolase [Patescibacteria group bacterium]